MFTVANITPRYDESTDALLGTQTLSIESFETFSEAAHYLLAVNGNDDWDDYHVILLPNGNRVENLFPHARATCAVNSNSPWGYQPTQF